LFASEMTKPTIVGDAIFLWINTGGDEETRSIFSKLAQDGKITAELQMVYWGKEFGAITDKYGINWYVSSI
jgi:PhnB protein